MRNISIITRLTDDKSVRDRLSGILRFCGSRPDWQLHIISVPTTAAAVGHLKNDRPDGLICNAIPDTTPLASLCGVPTVVIDAALVPKGFASVQIDDASIAKAACSVLFRRKCGHLAYVGSSDKHHRPHNDVRERTVRAFASTCELSFHSFTINPNPRNVSSINKLAEGFKCLPLPCGIVAFNDAVSRIVLDGAHLAHLKVPDQIAIIGVDNDTSVCENMRPSLSSILPDFEQSGFVAAQTLDKLMTSAKPLNRPFTYGLRNIVERESTQDVHGSARIASQAQQIIRQDLLGKTKIADVADELNISKRFLEQRFKAVFGRTMRAELTSIRLEQAKELLTTTALPLYEISVRCGSDRFASFAALFRRNIGMTMSAYRKTQKSPPQTKSPDKIHKIKISTAFVM